MLSLDRGTGIESIVLTALYLVSEICIRDVSLLLDWWTGIERIIDLRVDI